MIFHLELQDEVNTLKKQVNEQTDYILRLEERLDNLERKVRAIMLKEKK